MHESTIPVFPPHLHCPHHCKILVHDYCVIYDVLPPPLLYANTIQYWQRQYRVKGNPYPDVLFNCNCKHQTRECVRVRACAGADDYLHTYIHTRECQSATPTLPTPQFRHGDPRRYLCGSPPVALVTRRRARQTAPG